MRVRPVADQFISNVGINELDVVFKEGNEATQVSHYSRPVFIQGREIPIGHDTSSTESGSRR